MEGALQALPGRRCDEPRRLRGPALRRGRRRRLRVAGAGGGGAPGAGDARHRAHHLRPRLRDLAERAARGPGAAERRRRRAVPGRGGAGPRGLQRLSEPLYGGPHSEADELDWLRRQGPYAPRLVEAIEKRKGEFDAVVFFTYLYYPTYLGLQAAPERSVLVPTAHDEPPLRFRIYDAVFARPRALAFCSAPERELVRSRFGLGGRPAAVTGIGVDVADPGAGDVDGFRIRHDVRAALRPVRGPHRRGQGLRGDGGVLRPLPPRPRGRGGAAPDRARWPWRPPRVPGVRYLGYLSEEEKRAALAGARAVVCPSPFESLSIVLLEGFALGTPALASARSPVLKDHCVRSQGGLFYAERRGVREALDLLVREPRLRAALGENGRRYVRESYRWEAVLARYRALIEAAAASPP